MRGAPAWTIICFLHPNYRFLNKTVYCHLSALSPFISMPLSNIWACVFLMWWRSSLVMTLKYPCTAASRPPWMPKHCLDSFFFSWEKRKESQGATSLKGLNQYTMHFPQSLAQEVISFYETSLISQICLIIGYIRMTGVFLSANF